MASEAAFRPDRSSCSSGQWQTLDQRLRAAVEASTLGSSPLVPSLRQPGYASRQLATGCASTWLRPALPGHRAPHHMRCHHRASQTPLIAHADTRRQQQRKVNGLDSLRFESRPCEEAFNRARGVGNAIFVGQQRRERVRTLGHRNCARVPGTRHQTTGYVYQVRVSS